MSHEMIYTSAPAGLKPGANGFCTVAATAGLPAPVTQRLEMLSAYRELYPPGDPRASLNPVAWSHWRLAAGPRATSVLSRVAPAGMDHTGRANTIAHHLLVEPPEQPPAGPAWLLSQPGLLDSTWTGPPRTLPVGRPIPAGSDGPDGSAGCPAWAAATGDAGWAGVFAATAAADLPRVAYLIYDPAAGHDPLPLLREAMALLPPHRRWAVAFTTYFTELPASLACHWRCCPAGTPAAKEARRNATSGVVLDLTQLLGAAPADALARVAPTRHATEADDDGDGADVHHPVSFATPALNLRAPARMAFPTAAGAVPVVPMLPVGTLVDGPAVSPAPTAAEPVGRRPRVLLWAAAILWPLLVIPAVVAWHVSAESQRNQTLLAELEQLRTVGEATHNRSTRPSAVDDKNDAGLGTVKAESKAVGTSVSTPARGSQGTDVPQPSASSDPKGAAVADLHASGTGETKTGEHSVPTTPKELPGIPAGPTPPTAVPGRTPTSEATIVSPHASEANPPIPTRRLLTPFALAPVLDKRLTLYSSEMAVTQIKVVTMPCTEKTHVSLFPAQTSATTISVKWDGETRNKPGETGPVSKFSRTDASVSVEQRMGIWVVFWKWEYQPERQTGEYADLERWLAHSGVVITFQDSSTVAIGMGSSTESLSLISKEAKRSEFAKDMKGQQCPLATVILGQNDGWNYSVDPSSPFKYEFHYKVTDKSDFYVTVDSTSGCITTNYLKVLSKAENTAELNATIKQLQAAATRAHDEANALQEKMKKGGGEPQLANNLENLDSIALAADQAVQNAQNNMSIMIDAGNALKSIKPVVIWWSDPTTALRWKELVITTEKAK